jgi:UDP-N-acetylmuramoyl-tripeptide--D-alanyl-D-alanine ligase
MIKFLDLTRLKNSKVINAEKISRNNFKGVSIDSRIVKSNEIFIAIKGENTDGHNYIRDVFNKGVQVAVVNKRWYYRNKMEFTKRTFITVKDTIKSLGELAKYHKEKFSIPVLCIAGSNGKTTTKDLVSAVLSEKYKVHKTIGNFNNHIGLPLSILKINRNHEFSVLELGANHFDEVKYLCNIAVPDYGLVTNIGKEHLEFFRNEKGVAKAEFELFDYIISKGKDALCFMNFDDTYIRDYYKRKNLKNVLKYSYRFNTSIKGRFIKYNKNFEPVIEISGNKGTLKTSVSTFGKHSIFNGLAAAAVGLYFGVEYKSIKKALSNFTLESSKRMQIINSNGITFINDTYNSNPDSVKMGLETILDYNSKGTKHIVLSDMLELGESSEREHRAVGRLVRKMGFNNLYTHGKESYNTFLAAKGLDDNYYFDSKTDMVTFLKAVIKRRDIIYVKGSRGMKMEEVIDSLIN